MNAYERLCRGKEYWNHWAQEMIERKDRGRDWEKEASASFDDRAMQESDFSGLSFPGPVTFAGKSFPKDVDFSGSEFHRSVSFEGVVFQGTATFEAVTFHGNAGFGKTAFMMDAFFCRDIRGKEFQSKAESQAVVDQTAPATFEGEADFSESTFHGEALFTCVTFQAEGDRSRLRTGEPRGRTITPTDRMTSYEFRNSKKTGDFDRYSSYETSFRKATFEQSVFFSWDFRMLRSSHAEVGDFPNAATSFLGPALFDGATFKATAWFRSGVFSDLFHMSDATFCDGAMFRYSKFHSYAYFERTRFEEKANFNDAFFAPADDDESLTITVNEHGHPFPQISFRGVNFLSIATFDRARFRYDADFSGCIAKSQFVLMEEVSRDMPPDFTQAVFDEAPDFGEASWPQETTGKSRSEVRRFVDGFPSRAIAEARDNMAKPDDVSRALINKVMSRWRALKVLAAKGGDHRHALCFYREEMIVSMELKGSGQGLTRWLYGLLSDFGCSVRRPLGFWFGTTVFFSIVFSALCCRTECVAQPKSFFGSGVCLVDCRTENQSYLDALGLSLRFGLPVVSASINNASNQAFYRDQPIPVVVLIAGAAQSILSATFIFLFLLGLRNRFRM